MCIITLFMFVGKHQLRENIFLSTHVTSSCVTKCIHETISFQNQIRNWLTLRTFVKTYMFHDILTSCYYVINRYFETVESFPISLLKLFWDVDTVSWDWCDWSRLYRGRRMKRPRFFTVWQRLSVKTVNQTVNILSQGRRRLMGTFSRCCDKTTVHRCYFCTGSWTSYGLNPLNRTSISSTRSMQ